ncbi:hypothetical protein CCACVL1_01102 [Corchorus capsularis]|uniref:Uncharacterized protein n=1 Tax=Corchorus capsularis TaxID=210143 RepID=A0A1R3KNR6_COCAP|nr:hypothetical protein CCACVL1_01102 [Corchorus capsularis]
MACFGCVKTAPSQIKGLRPIVKSFDLFLRPVRGNLGS